MEARAAVHPSVEVLRALGSGKLNDAAVATVVNHLETCNDCQARLASLSGDAFLARLRAAHRSSDSPAVTHSVSGPSTVRPSTPAAPPPDEIPPELRSLTQYEMLRELGRGGMGVVYLAKNKLMDREEVLKVVNQRLLGADGGAERFLREIRAAARLNHPNIVTAYSTLQAGDLHIFAMEYVVGEDLDKFVKSRGLLPVANACFYIQQAAWACSTLTKRAWCIATSSRAT